MTAAVAAAMAAVARALVAGAGALKVLVRGVVASTMPARVNSQSRTRSHDPPLDLRCVSNCIAKALTTGSVLDIPTACCICEMPRRSS